MSSFTQRPRGINKGNKSTVWNQPEKHMAHLHKCGLLFKPYSGVHACILTSHTSLSSSNTVPFMLCCFGPVFLVLLHSTCQDEATNTGISHNQIISCYHYMAFSHCFWLFISHNWMKIYSQKVYFYSLVVFPWNIQEKAYVGSHFSNKKTKHFYFFQKWSQVSKLWIYRSISTC